MEFLAGKVDHPSNESVVAIACRFVPRGNILADTPSQVLLQPGSSLPRHGVAHMGGL